jgi:hypothetical protein
VTLEGVGTVEENDEVTITCTVTGTRDRLTSLQLMSFPFTSSGNAQIINNATLHNRTETFDGATNTYTTILQTPPITMEGSSNGRTILCIGAINSSFFSQNKKFTVFCKFSILVMLKISI